MPYYRQYTISLQHHAQMCLTRVHISRDASLIIGAYATSYNKLTMLKTRISYEQTVNKKTIC